MAQTRVTITRDVGRLLREASLPQLEAIRESAEEALDRNTPVGKTGKLKESRYARLDRIRGVVQVGVDRPYARFVVYGFVHWISGKFIPGNNFLLKSLDEAIRANRRRR
jgi:hypothetical protein